tara:strand:- start:47 stop:799 length:753 start_codon:yes stop_codon:yes gene_type:complete
MKKGLVSIIIPYYKKKKFFKKTFISAVNQSYKNIEIIIIYDDNSKSELKFIKKIVQNKKNTKVLVNSKNIGAGLSRNRGIKKSKGEYLAFLDADDLWKKNKLQKQIRFMNTNKIDASFTGYQIMDEKNNIFGSRISKKKISYNNLIYSCDIGLSTVVIRKQKLINLNCYFPSLKTKEDYLLWLKLSKKGLIFYGISNTLSYWKKTTNSLSSNVLQKMSDGFKVYFIYLNFSFFKSLFHLFILSINYLRKN